MAERTAEMKKLVAIAADLEISSELRIKATEQIGNISSHEALLILLELAANERLNTKERDFALQQARKIIKSGR